MTVSEATIPRDTADGAREDVEEFNKDILAQAKVAETPTSPMVRLQYEPDTRTRMIS